MRRRPDGRMRFVKTRLALLAGGAALGYAGFRGLLGGALTLDLGIGRRTRPLGPRTADIAAPPEAVFDIIARPYLHPGPPQDGDGIRLLATGSDLVLAAHRIPLPDGRVVATTETVRFDRPGRVEYRLIRGPVPMAAETYEIVASGGGTHVTYTGTIGTDLWAAGQIWGNLVARRWEAVVTSFLHDVRAEAESA